MESIWSGHESIMKRSEDQRFSRCCLLCLAISATVGSYLFGLRKQTAHGRTGRRRCCCCLLEPTPGGVGGGTRSSQNDAFSQRPEYFRDCVINNGWCDPPRSPDELFNRRPILTNVSGGDRILFNTKLLAEGFNRLTSQCMCWTVKQRRQGWNPCYCIHLIQDFCPLPPLANKAISTQYWSSQHYWEDQKTRERTDHSPSMPRLRKEVARLIQGLLRGCSSVLLSICRERYQNYKTNVIKQKIESSFNRR